MTDPGTPASGCDGGRPLRRSASQASGLLAVAAASRCSPGRLFFGLAVLYAPLPRLVVLVIVAALRRAGVVSACGRLFGRGRLAGLAGHVMKATVEALPQPAFMLDATGVVRYANGSAASVSRNPAGRRLSRSPSGARNSARRSESRGPASRRRWSSASRARRPTSMRCTLSPVARRASGALHPGHLRRVSGAAGDRPHAGRFRRQCQPRTAHAARLADRVHRDAARPGARRPGGARAIPRRHGGAGAAHAPADRRSAVAVAHRDAASTAGPPARSTSARVCEQSPTRCSRSARSATWSSRSSAGRRRSMVIGDRDELVQVVEEPGGERAEIRRVRRAGRASSSARAAAGRLAARRACATTGRASPPEQLPRLTERFYRVERRQPRSKRGTGLGLAIVKHIVNRHRGQLDDRKRARRTALGFTIVLAAAGGTTTHEN